MRAIIVRKPESFRSDLRSVLDGGSGDVGLSQRERAMLRNILSLRERHVVDVMVPRADIIAVEQDTSVSDLVALFGEAQHSRLPVYRETLDDPAGLVHIKDVLALIEPQGDGFHWRKAAISEIKRPILFVAPSMPVLDLLVKMQTTHIQLALVIDEYGGTDGLVSIEDLIEEISQTCLGRHGQHQ